MGVVRIGVFADSHGNLRALRDAVRRAGKLDMAVHLGDYAGDARILTEEGLALWFPQESLAPRNAGLPTVLLPYAALEGLLRFSF